MKRNIPLWAVFFTGAAVLVIEVAATRVLAPYYGNTIYTFSSVIGVILAALSLGYYFGGKLADRHPSPVLFFGIIGAGGACVLLLHLLNVLFLPRIAYRLSLVSGPLLLSLLLFALPALLLGTLSPFAIKLMQMAQPAEGVGSLSGKVFFWSTVGSILGSLAAGFLLVPHLGVSRIMIATGIALLLLSALGLFMSGRRWTEPVAVLVAALIMGGAAAFVEARPYPPGVLYSRDGLYERITVAETLLDGGRPARLLQQDRAVSGILYLDTDEVTDYMQYVDVATLVKPEIRSALIIGGGAYLLPKHLLQTQPNVTVDVVEIEPGLLEVGRRFFRVPTDSPRLRNHITDGRRFLHETRTEYDLIFSDVFYALTIPSHIATREFFELAKDRLSSNGVFMANFFGDTLPEAPSILLTEIKTMRAVFPNSYFFAVNSATSTEVQGVIAVGINGDARLDLDSPEVVQHPNPVIRSLAQHRLNPDQLALDAQPILTDDYAPTEYISLKSHRRELEGGG